MRLVGNAPSFTTNRPMTKPGQYIADKCAAIAIDDIDIETGRRIRLLAFVDASFYTPFVQRAGKRYPIYTGDPQWFSDNIPCMTACP